MALSTTAKPFQSLLCVCYQDQNLSSCTPSQAKLARTRRQTSSHEPGVTLPRPPPAGTKSPGYNLLLCQFVVVLLQREHRVLQLQHTCDILTESSRPVTRFFPHFVPGFMNPENGVCPLPHPTGA